MREARPLTPIDLMRGQLLGTSGCQKGVLPFYLQVSAR